ncbi:flagellar basal body rod protein FlgC [Chromobacterium haemolyticum]|uniref:flagellar basal body rod protein FlgC n=1 Tax=Chromobacterium haemolyticum TaxID=394935 RepID=UPI0009DB6016|nr:flagellar basal body rod protein FlgC [Chromobacterium haemolyticum]OQS33866.1 flagellar basal body rod protein FlgC [Chromobacterium haemolyticum]
MSFRDIAQIAGSAMTAQTVRMNAIASNMANAEVATEGEGEAYRARKPVFASMLLQGGKVADGAVGVQVLDVVESPQPLRQVYQPGHPMADESGNVFYSNVDMVEEMTDMLSASRAFASNVELLTRSNIMQQALLKMGQ